MLLCILDYILLKLIIFTNIYNLIVQLLIYLKYYIKIKFDILFINFSLVLLSKIFIYSLKLHMSI